MKLDPELASSPDRLVRKPQACAFLGISFATLDRRVAAGKLRRIKLERISAYRVADLLAYAAGEKANEEATLSTKDGEGLQ